MTSEKAMRATADTHRARSIDAGYLVQFCPPSPARFASTIENEWTLRPAHVRRL